MAMATPRTTLCIFASIVLFFQMKTLVASIKFLQRNTSPNSALRFLLMCFLVNTRCLQHSNTVDSHFIQSDDFLVFKDIRSDAIEMHLTVSLWFEMNILIFKRFTAVIGSPIVACPSPSVTLVARLVVKCFSCYDFTWRNCEDPTVLLFHGWFSNWVICTQTSPLHQGSRFFVPSRYLHRICWHIRGRLLVVSSLLLWNCF